VVGRPRKLDAGEQARVLALRDREGRTLREIAALYGVGIATVSRVYTQAKRQQEAEGGPVPDASAAAAGRAAGRADRATGRPGGAAARPSAPPSDAAAGPGPGEERQRPVLSLAALPAAEEAASGTEPGERAGEDPGRSLEAAVAEALTAYRRWQAEPDEARYGAVDDSLAKVRRALAAIEIELWTAT